MEDDLLNEMEALWAPPDNPVFELTSKSFNTCVQRFYSDIGCPTIHYNSIWDVFSELKDRIEDQLEDGGWATVATEFNSLQQNFEQDAQLVDLEPPGEDEAQDSFFDDRLFTDDEDDDINRDGDGVEYEIELTEDEEDDEEVDHYLTDLA